jgi:hypothetical protein
MLGGAIVPEGDAASGAALAFGVTGGGMEMRQQTLARQRVEAFDMADKAAVDEVRGAAGKQVAGFCLATR